ncbi:Putative transposable element [Caligus rogercresseyi]|uniref:Transposable element n=1 Tax=Caligus rogercresseyi TaxID=217165 RepID=A0A7T8QRW0_CALRO|nr:Putative transposable element [Caligus rogercresseyi]
MRQKVIPSIKKVAGDRPYVFQQDGAPAHTSKATQAFMYENLNFWAKDMWPPQNPDLNPLDFSI